MPCQGAGWAFQDCEPSIFYFLGGCRCFASHSRQLNGPYLPAVVFHFALASPHQGHEKYRKKFPQFIVLVVVNIAMV